MLKTVDDSGVKGVIRAPVPEYEIKGLGDDGKVTHARVSAQKVLGYTVGQSVPEDFLTEDLGIVVNITADVRDEDVQVKGTLEITEFTGYLDNVIELILKDNIKRPNELMSIPVV